MYHELNFDPTIQAPPSGGDWMGVHGQALAEGWDLFSLDCGRVGIQRLDDPSLDDLGYDAPKFEHDDAAWDFVVAQANAGSAYHRIALGYLARHNNAVEAHERTLIRAMFDAENLADCLDTFGIGGLNDVQVRLRDRKAGPPAPEDVARAEAALVENDRRSIEAVAEFRPIASRHSYGVDYRPFNASGTRSGQPFHLRWAHQGRNDYIAAFKSLSALEINFRARAGL